MRKDNKETGSEQRGDTHLVKAVVLRVTGFGAEQP